MSKLSYDIGRLLGKQAAAGPMGAAPMTGAPATGVPPGASQLPGGKLPMPAPRTVGGQASATPKNPTPSPDNQMRQWLGGANKLKTLPLDKAMNAAPGVQRKLRQGQGTPPTRNL